MIEEDGKHRSVFRWVGCGSSFGANPLRQEVGLGQARGIAVLEVFWPATGQVQRFYDVAVDQFIEVTEGESEYRRLTRRPIKFQAMPPAK